MQNAATAAIHYRWVRCYFLLTASTGATLNPTFKLLKGHCIPVVHQPHCDQ